MFYQHINQVKNKRRSTITAAMKMLNNISIALDKKQHYALLFINLSKAFNTIDHDVLKLLNSILSEQAIPLFSGLGALDMMVYVQILYQSTRVYHKVLYYDHFYSLFIKIIWVKTCQMLIFIFKLMTL